MEYISLFYYSLVGMLGLVIGYFTTYTKEKAKNIALKQDIVEITEKSETVIADLKLQHEKKKYQYEKKHQVYSKYHNLLDKFNSENSIIDRNKTEPLMSSLVNALCEFQDNEPEKMKAINHFGDEFNLLIREAMTGLKEIAIKTNEIKLVGTDDINNVLKKLNDNYKKVGEISQLPFKDPNNLIIGQVDFSSISRQLKELTSDTDELRFQCIKLMKEDLEKI